MNHSRTRTVLTIVTLVASFWLWVGAARAADPSPESVLAKMKAALEPARPSTRTMSFRIHSAAFNEDVQLAARQARKTLPSGARSVTVITSPEISKGIALLVVEEKGKPNTEYIYTPALRRSRRLVGPSTFEPFLGTDFTYADVGLLDVRDRTVKLLGTKPHDGTNAFELEETLKNQWYYSRIVDWIAVDTGLPLERDHYDVANRLWRKQTFDRVETVDGVPTPMHVRIDDVQSGDWSDYTLSDVKYDAQLSDDVFDPTKLRDVAGRSDWSVK